MNTLKELVNVNLNIAGERAALPLEYNRAYDALAIQNDSIYPAPQPWPDSIAELVIAERKCNSFIGKL